jgi:hypothetical protein
MYCLMVKIKKMRERDDSMSHLFLTVLINTVFEDWGRYTDFFASRLLVFWGDVGGGGVLSAFSKEKLRFTVFSFSLQCRQCTIDVNGGIN